MIEKALDGLCFAKRADHYRRFASEAVEKAEASTIPAERAEYFAIASKWHAFAVEAEGLSGPGPSQSRIKGASMEPRATPYNGVQPTNFCVDFFKYDQHLCAVEYATSLAAAHKEAIAGLARLGADRATISDKGDGGKTLLVICG